MMSVPASFSAFASHAACQGHNVLRGLRNPDLGDGPSRYCNDLLLRLELAFSQHPGQDSDIDCRLDITRAEGHVEGGHDRGQRATNTPLLKARDHASVALVSACYGLGFRHILVTAEPDRPKRGLAPGSDTSGVGSSCRVMGRSNVHDSPRPSSTPYTAADEACHSLRLLRVAHQRCRMASA